MVVPQLGVASDPHFLHSPAHQQSCKSGIRKIWHTIMIGWSETLSNRVGREERGAYRTRGTLVGCGRGAGRRGAAAAV